MEFRESPQRVSGDLCSRSVFLGFPLHTSETGLEGEPYQISDICDQLLRLDATGFRVVAASNFWKEGYSQG